MVEDMLQSMFQIISPLQGYLALSSASRSTARTTPATNPELITATMALSDNINVYDSISEQIGADINIDDFNDTWSHYNNFGCNGVMMTDLRNTLA
jgi:hypothetical protein